MQTAIKKLFLEDSNKRFGPLDGLRGIAVLIVFLSHTSGRDIYISSLLKFNGIGHIGVYLFFCLSAYLLVGKLLSKTLDKKAIIDFFIRRLFRIWPLYFVVLLAVLFMQNGLDIYDTKYLHIKNGLLGVFQHFIFYRGDSVFWSVVVEEQFYVIVPFLVIFYKSKPKIAILVFAVFAIMNFGLYLAHHTGFPINTDAIKYITTNNRSSGNYLDVFLTCIIFVIAENKYQYLIKQYSKIYFKISNTLFFITLILSFVLVSEKFIIFNRPFYNFRFITMFFVIGFMPFTMSLKYGNPAIKLLNGWLLKKIGLYGFSVYLLHFFVFQAINYHLDVSPQLKLLIAAPALFFLCFLTYHLIEKPFIVYSYKISGRRTNKFKDIANVVS